MLSSILIFRSSGHPHVRKDRGEGKSPIRTILHHGGCITAVAEGMCPCCHQCWSPEVQDIYMEEKIKERVSLVCVYNNVYWWDIAPGAGGTWSHLYLILISRIIGHLHGGKDEGKGKAVYTLGVFFWSLHSPPYIDKRCRGWSNSGFLAGPFDRSRSNDRLLLNREGYMWIKIPPVATEPDAFRYIYTQL